MPELPEVETAKNGIRPYVEGCKIEKITIRTPKLRWTISQELYHLSQEKIEKISRRAKYLIFHLQYGYIIVHLGMSGSLRIVEPSHTASKHDHVDVTLDNGKILRYNDPRKFGAWLWTDNIAEFALFQKLGPEPLSEQFNADYLWQKSRQKNTALKTFLMNNQFVVGVGNIYANESLFQCGLHPNLPAEKLSYAQAEQLVDIIKNILETAIKQGGTTLQDFLQPDGRPGYFAQKLQVYGRKNEPCIKCGHPIESMFIGQRNSFYCPLCQPINKDN